MREIVNSKKIKGYNKTHEFSIEKYTLSGYTFYHVLKNGSIILNCTENEFNKMKDLFNV